MKRKRKKWERRIVPIILSMALSVSSFSGFYYPVYAEDEISQEVSTEEISPDQPEIPEDQSEDQEVVRDEQLTDTASEEATEAVAETTTEVITETAAEEIIESNSEIQSLDEQAVDEDDEKTVEDTTLETPAEVIQEEPDSDEREASEDVLASEEELVPDGDSEEPVLAEPITLYAVTASGDVETYDVYEHSKVTTSYATVGNFMIEDSAGNDFRAFCTQHNSATPYDSYDCTKVLIRNNYMLAVLYYGYGGIAQWSGFSNANDAIACTSLALSHYNGDTTGTGSTSSSTAVLSGFYNHVEQNVNNVPYIGLDQSLDSNIVYSGTDGATNVVTINDASLLKLSNATGYISNANPLKSTISGSVVQTENMTVYLSDNATSAVRLYLPVPDGATAYVNGTAKAADNGKIEVSKGDTVYFTLPLGSDYTGKKRYQAVTNKVMVAAYMLESTSSSVQNLCYTYVSEIPVEYYIEWENGNPGAFRLTKKANPSSTDLSTYPLSGAQYTVYYSRSGAPDYNDDYSAKSGTTIVGRFQTDYLGRCHVIYNYNNPSNVCKNLSTNALADADNHYILDELEIGNYLALETRAPYKYYELDETEYRFTVTTNDDPNTPKTWTSTDDRIEYGFDVQKVMGDSNGVALNSSYYSLKGAVYYAYTDAACTERALTTKGNNVKLVTDELGNTKSVKMDPGVYYIKEITPSPGCDLDTHTYKVTLNDTNPHATITSTEPPKSARLSLKKVSSKPSVTDSNSSYSYKDAVYNVYTNAACTKQAKTTGGDDAVLRTKADGTSNTVKLFYRKYYIKEVEAPEGYELDITRYSVNLTEENDSDPVVVTVEDEPKSGELTLKKVSSNPEITDGNNYYSFEGAVYWVYTDAACSTRATKTNGNNAILTTDASGESNAIKLYYGKYYIKEHKAPEGYELDTKVYRVDINNADNEVTVMVEDPPILSRVTLMKQSGNTSVTANNRMYSLAGAEYQVYTDAACTNKAKAILYNAAGEITGTTNALLTTTADGTTNVISLAKGRYFVKETKASPGYLLDPDPKMVDLRNYTSDDPYEVTSIEKPVGDPAELVLTKTDSEGITMVRTGTDGDVITTIGNATLEGAVFKVSYYDDLYDSNSISGKTPKAVWYIQTKYDDNYGEYRARLLQDYLSPDYTSSDFYIIDNRVEFPLGTVTFEEFRPASGYNNLDQGGVMTHAGGVAADNMTIMQIRMNGTSASAYVENPATNEYTTNADGTRIHVFTTAQDGSEISVKEEIKRSDLAFQKLNYVTYRPMANVFFRITSSTGESHIIKTDANGYFTSDSAEISHLTNTNGYDDIYQVEDDSAALALGDCGIWFYGTDDQTEWNAALIDDDKGAFRYDENYILQELPCTANRGMQMLPPVTVSLTNDNRLTFTGSYTNVPVPEIHTLEWDEFFGEGSHTSVVQEGVVSAIHDTVDYKYLTENTTYTLKTILMELDADGELVGPLLDAEGNMIRANTVITTPTSATASTQSICGTVDVKLEVIASAENNTLKDKRFVIFEYLYEGNDQELIEVDADGNPVSGDTVAEHADSTDENQMGYFLDIHTKILQHDNDSREAKISDSMLVSDQVTYNGLDTMNEYRLEAVLKLVDTEGNEIGDIVDAEGNPITAVKYFIPDEVSGTVQVDFPEFDGYQVISNNRILGNIVAYETLYMGRRTLVKHHNPKDQDQTLYVRPQGRIRVYKTGDQVVAATQYTSVYGDFHRLSFDQKPLAGTEFEIHSAMDDSLIETIVTDRTGYAESSDLAWGEYYLIETRTRNGLIRSTDPIAVTLLCPENYRGYWYYEKLDVENAVGDTEINVYKQGEILDIENKTYSFGHKPLEGVIFGVYTAEPILDYAGDPVIQSDECIGFIRTGADGKAALRDALVEGRFYYKEIHTLEGYILDETKHEFQLVLGNEELTSFDVNKENPDVNQLYKTKLQLTKRDSKDGHTISGVEFALYNEKDECMGIYVTDEQGRILIDDLPYGRYYFVEQKAAEDYILDSSPQVFVARTDAASMDVTNDRIPDTPKTGDMNPIVPVAAIGILAFMIACILAVIILQQNRQV